MNDKKTSPSDFTWIKRSIDLFLDRDEDGLASSRRRRANSFRELREKMLACSVHTDMFTLLSEEETLTR